MKEKYIEYKKITVEIPYKTYLAMLDYCYNKSTGRREMYLCDLVDRAVCKYLNC